MVDQYFQGNSQQQPQPVQQPAPQPVPYQQPSGDSELTIGSWVVTLLITFIPIVGLVMLFVWGFGSSTPTPKKNWALANLIWYAIGIVLCVLLSVLGVFSLAALSQYGTLS